MTEMWLKQWTLVLLTVAGMVVSSEQCVILDEKSKEKEDIPLGSSLTLCCRLDTTNYKRFNLQWSFRPLGSSAKRSNLSGRVVNGHPNDSLPDINKNLTIPNVTQNNSGWYFCSVKDELNFNSSESNGTQVVIAKSLMEATVYPPLMTKDPPPIQWWMWLLLGVSTFVLIVLVVICVMLRRRFHRSRVDQVYENTHPVAYKQPSPRPSLTMNSLKTQPSSDDFWTPKSNRIYTNGEFKQKKRGGQ